MWALLSNGTADITNDVLSHLRKKHPTRTEPIAHPVSYPGLSESTDNTYTHAPNGTEVDHDTDDPEGSGDRGTLAQQDDNVASARGDEAEQKD